MTETKSTRRAAIRSLLTFPLAAAGLAALSGCGGEKTYPVIESKKPKDELHKDIENPFGGEFKQGKPKKRR